MHKSTLRALFRFGFWQFSHESVAHLGRLLTYTMLLLVFGSIYGITPWHEVQPRHPSLRLDAISLATYLAITEAVVFGVGYTFRSIFDDIRSGQFAQMSGRPVAYTWLKIIPLVASSYGQYLLHLAYAIALLALLHKLALGQIWQYLWLLPLGLGAIILLVQVQFCIGLFEIYGDYARPCMWLVSKTNFLLGGLILPLPLYPAVLQMAAAATPFPAILYAPAQIAIQQSATPLWHWLLLQIIWIGIMSYFCYAALRRTQKHLAQRGD